MVSEIIRQLDFNLAYANKLVEDVSDDQMTVKPSAGLENHPAWTLGHLAMAFANLGNNLTGELVIPEKWKELFARKGPGDPTLPHQDASAYPSKKELLDELHAQHERLIHILLEAKAQKKLSENFKWRFDSFLPTYLDRIMFLCVNHYAMHLGQLAAWRRAMRLPSALAEVK